MNQWRQPDYQPRRDQLPPPAVPPEFQRHPARDPWRDSVQPYRPAPQPQFPAAPHPPAAPYGWQPQPPPVQVNVIQQNGGHAAVTVQGLGAGWTLFHLCMTLGTCGLWIPVWVIHASSRRRVTVYR